MAKVKVATGAGAAAARGWTPNEAWVRAFSGKGFPTTGSKMRKFVSSVLGWDAKLDKSLLESAAAEFATVPVEARKGAEAGKLLTDFGNKLERIAKSTPETKGIKGAISRFLGLNTSVPNKALAEATGGKLSSRLLGGIGKAANFAILAQLYGDMFSPTMKGLGELSSLRKAAVPPEGMTEEGARSQLASDMAMNEILDLMRQRRMFRDAAGEGGGSANLGGLASLLKANTLMQQQQMGAGMPQIPGAIQA